MNNYFIKCWSKKMKKMKKIVIVLLLSLAAFSCITTGDLADRLAGNVAEDVVSAVASDISEAPAEPAETTPPADPPKPAKIVPSEEQIVDAVKAYDLELLIELLAEVDDVKTIVGADVLLLHMAEDAMGLTGEKNEMLALLVEKKAYLLQRDENGKSFDRFVMKMEMGGTERHEYIIEVLGDKFQKRIEALRADNLEEIITMKDYMPVDSYLLKSAVEEKAGKIAAWVIEQGVSADLIDSKKGEGLLHLACNGKPYDYAFDKRIELVNDLIAAGAEVNLKDKNGDTPIGILFNAISTGKLGTPDLLLKVLLAAGADVNTITSKNRSLLQIAAEAKLDETVSLLIDDGAVIDEGTLASMNLSPEAMTLFMDKGAEPINFVDNIQGIIEPEAQHEFVAVLMGNGADASDFDLRLVRNNFRTLMYLVESGADLRSSDVLMSCIADYKGMATIEYLVENGADLAKKYYRDMTALHFAVKYKRNEAVVYLIENGASLNPVDSTGKTPLDYCGSRNKTLNATLVDAGAKKASEL